MKLVEQFETLSVEDAKQAVMQELSMRALRVVSEGITINKNETKYSFKAAAPKFPEGEIHALDVDPANAEVALGAPQGFLKSDDKYGPTGIITGTDGSLHSIYTRDGNIRIRPMHTTTKEHTAALKKFIGVNESSIVEAAEDNRDGSQAQLDEAASFATGKTVYTSHTGNVAEGTIVKKDTDNDNHFIVKIQGQDHSVHADHIHITKAQAGYMCESAITKLETK